MQSPEALARELKFRDPERARALAEALRREVAAIGRAPVQLMHVCGTHEQAIARFGLRAAFPPDLHVIMGPGCPVCITDMPEVDEAVALCLDGKRVCTYGDMLKVPGTARSLGDAQAEGGKVEVIYSPTQAMELARKHPGEEVVFFATGFETTAVTTAAAILQGLPPNLSVLSAHKYVPPAMEVVAGMPDSKVEGFLAAGHAAAITGWAIFEPMAARHRLPIVVAGFEPLDVLAALVKLVELVKERRPEVVNMYPRVVTRDGNRPALAMLQRVFQMDGGRWRGIAHIPDGNLRLRDEYAAVDARRRFAIDLGRLSGQAPRQEAALCICGLIMSGQKVPTDCTLYGKECTPEAPVGACMVSSEGSCRIWHTYGGVPDLRGVGT
ncbi:MAG: hydrogenase formation protein HypD [Deltaproteobacteria bacterium]|nr:hydrogenase formation protein HypD [Deltaproteobacteria bacterium]